MNRFRNPVVALALVAVAASNAQTAVSSTFQLGVYADANQNFGAYHQDYLIQSQGTTLNPYSGNLAVTDDDGANPGHNLTVRSSASASWLNSGRGAVQWRGMGWQHNTITSSGSKLNGFVINGPVWSYTFTATANDTFNVDYDVRGFGNVFGLLGAVIQWSGPGGNLDLTNAYNPAAHGTFSRSITSGNTYTVGLFNMGNVFTAPILRQDFGYMDADFNWRVGPVPEPSSLLAFGGLVAVAIRRRSRRP